MDDTVLKPHEEEVNLLSDLLVHPTAGSFLPGQGQELIFDLFVCSLGFLWIGWGWRSRAGKNLTDCTEYPRLSGFSGLGWWFDVSWLDCTLLTQTKGVLVRLSDWLGG
jgi:hypothetical protein